MKKRGREEKQVHAAEQERLFQHFDITDKEVQKQIKPYLEANNPATWSQIISILKSYPDMSSVYSSMDAM